MLRQELTLTDIDLHSAQVEKLDVEGLLAFAERVLPRASDLWVQASRTFAFRHVAPVDAVGSDLASLMPASWNRIAVWLERIDALRHAA